MYWNKWEKNDYNYEFKFIVIRSKNYGKVSHIKLNSQNYFNWSRQTPITKYFDSYIQKRILRPEKFIQGYLYLLYSNYFIFLHKSIWRKVVKVCSTYKAYIDELERIILMGSCN